MEIVKLVKKAKIKDESSINILYKKFKPLLIKNSYINNRFDEDIFEELSIEFLRCIDDFEFQNNDF